MNRDQLESASRTPRQATRKPPSLATAPAPSGELAAARARAASEIAALVRLAELDAALVAREGGLGRVPDEVADERRGLGAKLSPEIHEAYDRALRAGRRPAVVRLAANVCSGCNVRLHSTLEQRVRRRRGVGACPHCLRLVYDPAWLDTADPR
jgi:predicted  nucleic acid-binding Zn-ribbon protein